MLRHLWTNDGEPFEDKFSRFPGVTKLPKPAQSPCPIWLTTNAGRLDNSQADAGGSHSRCAGSGLWRMAG